MPRKVRNHKRRDQLADDAIAWLAGGRNCGFIQFKHDDELQALWDGHGDSETTYWKRGMARPITLEDLEAFEGAWLNSGNDDEYGGKSFFIGRFYSDEEKEKLWARGDTKRFHWRPGIWKPEAVAA